MHKVNVNIQNQGSWIIKHGEIESTHQATSAIIIGIVSTETKVVKATKAPAFFASLLNFIENITRVAPTGVLAETVILSHCGVHAAYVFSNVRV